MSFTKQIFLLVLLLIAQVYTQVGPLTPGACLEGQTDDTTHSASEYSPVLYTFPPSSAARTATTNTTIKFMSFNIQSDYSLYCGLDLTNQTQLVASIAPDFIGFQETDIDVDIRCNCNMPQLTADALGLTSRFMMMFPFRNGKYGDFAATAFDVLSLEYLYYNVSDSSFEQRGALAHLLQPPQLGGQYMWAINTHLEETDVDIRYIQVSQLVAWVSDTLLNQYPSAVVVITGDFYTLPGDKTYEAMADYFTNAWASYSGSTDGGFTHPSDVPTDRFDHIWYKAPADGSLAVSVTSFVIPVVLLSDHRPIYATLDFTPAGAGAAATTASAASTAASTATSTSGIPSDTTSGGTSTTGGIVDPRPADSEAAASVTTGNLATLCGLVLLVLSLHI